MTPISSIAYKYKMLIILQVLNTIHIEWSWTLEHQVFTCFEFNNYSSCYVNEFVSKHNKVVRTRKLQLRGFKSMKFKFSQIDKHILFCLTTPKHHLCPALRFVEFLRKIKSIHGKFTRYREKVLAMYTRYRDNWFVHYWN